MIAHNPSSLTPPRKADHDLDFRMSLGNSDNVARCLEVDRDGLLDQDVLLISMQQASCSSARVRWIHSDFQPTALRTNAPGAQTSNSPCPP